MGSPRIPGSGLFMIGCVPLVLGTVFGSIYALNGYSSHLANNRTIEAVGKDGTNLIRSKGLSGLSEDECLELLKKEFDQNKDNHLSAEEVARAQAAAVKLLSWGAAERNNPNAIENSRAGIQIQKTLNNWPWPNSSNLTRVPPSPLFKLSEQ